MTDSFSTKDLYLAGLIYSKGVRFQGIRREGKTCWFLFEDKDLCERLQQQFFAKTVETNAKNYADALRTLKNLVFADQ